MINKKMYHNSFLKCALVTIINMGVISSLHPAAPAQGLELSKLQSPKEILGELADKVLSIDGLRNLVIGYIGNWDIEKFKAYDGHHMACTPSLSGEYIFVIMSQLADAKTKKENGEKVDIVRYETVSGRYTKILTAHRPYTKIKCMPDGRLVVHNDTHAALYTPQGTLIENFDIAHKKLKKVGNKLLITPHHNCDGCDDRNRIQVVESDNSIRTHRLLCQASDIKIVDVRGSEIHGYPKNGSSHSMQFDDSSVLEIGTVGHTSHINTAGICKPRVRMMHDFGLPVSHLQRYGRGIMSVNGRGLVRLWSKENERVGARDLNPIFDGGLIPKPKKYQLAHRVGTHSFARYVAFNGGFYPKVAIMNFEGRVEMEIGPEQMEGSLGLIKVKPTSQGYAIHDAAGLFWCHQKNNIQRAYEHPAELPAIARPPAKRATLPAPRGSWDCPVM